jgi:Icc-related predicted phosphoesterase
VRILTVSDVHVDYQINRNWLSNLSSVDFLEDVLILAGDMTDRLKLLQQCFQELSTKFLKVIFVPGNHELWVSRDKTYNSFEKYRQICNVAVEQGISIQPFHVGSLSIVPLLGWYDFSFAEPTKELMDAWTDFHACSWPNELKPADINEYFLNKNTDNLKLANDTLISFSHFLPRIDLLPEYIPQKYHYIYPVLGSELLEKQIRILKPNIHIYGHSHVNRNVTIEGIQYVNNAFGYPSEGRITGKELLCIHEI